MRTCPMTSNFPFCQLVVLDRRRLPLNFPRPAADGPLADTFMQPGGSAEVVTQEPWQANFAVTSDRSEASETGKPDSLSGED
jgi:hypothetical protein